MSLLFAALISTVIDLLYALLLLAVAISLGVIAALLLAEAHQRIRSSLNRRRCWKEIEDARRLLILDEHVAGRRRVGLSDRESVAGRRSA